jgi:hypothetical protein
MEWPPSKEKTLNLGAPNKQLMFEEASQQEEGANEP